MTYSCGILIRQRFYNLYIFFFVFKATSININIRYYDQSLSVLLCLCLLIRILSVLCTCSGVQYEELYSMQYVPRSGTMFDIEIMDNMLFSFDLSMDSNSGLHHMAQTTIMFCELEQSGFSMVPAVFVNRGGYGFISYFSNDISSNYGFHSYFEHLAKPLDFHRDYNLRLNVTQNTLTVTVNGVKVVDELYPPHKQYLGKATCSVLAEFTNSTDPSILYQPAAADISHFHIKGGL